MTCGDILLPRAMATKLDALLAMYAGVNTYICHVVTVQASHNECWNVTKRDDQGLNPTNIRSWHIFILVINFHVCFFLVRPIDNPKERV